MRSVLTLALMLISAAACRADDRPYLDVWCVGDSMTDFMPNERAFWQSIEDDAGFREALVSTYQIRRFTIRRHADFCLLQGINCGPTFIIWNRDRIRGFRGADVFLAEIGLKRKSAAPQTAPAPPAEPAQQISLDELRSSLAKSLLEEINSRDQKLRAEQQTLSDQQRTESAAALVALHELESRLNLNSTSLTAGITDLRQQLQQIAGEFQRLSNPPPAPSGTGATPDSAATQPAESWWSRSVRIGSIALTVAQWTGLVTVSGGGLGVAGLAAWGISWWRKRHAGKQCQPAIKPPIRDQADLTPRPISSCPECKRKTQQLCEAANALKLTEQENTQMRDKTTELLATIEQLRQKPASPSSPVFAPYETDQFREAFEYAARELVRKYPGAVDNLEQLKSLIAQFLSSKGKGKAA